MKNLFHYLDKFITDGAMRFQYLNKLGFYRLLSDEEWIRKWYFVKSGGQKIDLENPETFNEKVQWYKLYYRRPIMTALVDKVRVRDYVEEKGLGSLLKEQYGVYDSFDDINFPGLPEVFYLKTNHGSGANRLIHKSEILNPAQRRFLKKYFQSSLKKNYYWKYREWAYKDVVPKLICEECLIPEDGRELIDFKFHCFDGKTKIIYYNQGLADAQGRHATAKRAVLDGQANYIKGARTQMEVVPEEQCYIPDCMDQMIRDAEILAADFPYVRVDFMYVNQKVYFGEMTFYSAAGYMRLEPPELLQKISGYLDIDKIRKENKTSY